MLLMKVSRLLLATSLFLALFFTPSRTTAQCQTIGAGNWSNPAIWTNCGGGIPTTATSVQVRHAITSTTNNSALNITFVDIGQPRSLTVSTGTLNVVGNFNTQFGTTTIVSAGHLHPFLSIGFL